MVEKAYLVTNEVAERYGLTPKTIKDWRRRKVGPPWYTLQPLGRPHGYPRVRYLIADLKTWEKLHQIDHVKFDE